MLFSATNCFGVYSLVKDHEKEFSSESVDAMKFICKDVWSVLFRKQIDNLKTNHKGTYELYENSPLWFMYTSPLKNSFKEEPIHNASLEFFSGVIAGVLDTLGYKSDVFGEFLEGNSCRFIVNII